MDKIRKILALLLIFTIVLSIAVTSFADDGDFLNSQEIDSWIEQYISDNNLSGNNKAVSVGYVYSRTGDEYYYNADEFMYSASLYKVPTCMLLAEKEAAGEINQQTQIVGSMTVEYLESTALINSNNDSGHYVADYVGKGVSAYDTYAGKDADVITKYAPDIKEDYYIDDFYNLSYYTARFMTKVMKTLYDGGDERFPSIVSYLKKAQPNNYYNVSMKGMYEIAQKYGAYEEKTGAKDNHCAAIIYTPNPIIVVVMTRNVTNYEKVISDIGAYLAEYSLSLDDKPIPTPTPLPTAEPTAEPTPQPTIVPLTTPAPSEPSEESSNGEVPVYALLIIPVLLAAIIILKVTKKKGTEYENYEEDYSDSYNEQKKIKSTYQRDGKIQKGKYTPKH